MRSSWALNHNDKCLCKRRERGKTQKGEGNVEIETAYQVTFLWAQITRIGCLAPPGDRESHQMDGPSESQEGINPVNTLISYFWPPELWNNKFLLFQAIRIVVLFYSSPKKLARCPSSRDKSQALSGLGMIVSTEQSNVIPLLAIVTTLLQGTMGRGRGEL